MEKEKLVPEEKRIWMGDFPLTPGDVVIMTLPCGEKEYPCPGLVIYVGSRNPDPGVAISLTTEKEFEDHIGGEHAGVALKRYDSMWVEIMFVRPHCEDKTVKKFFTYELVEMFAQNQIAKIDSVKDLFINFDNFLRYVREPKGAD